jgi:WD40-like Beta Propeller Repeat
MKNLRLPLTLCLSLALGAAACGDDSGPFQDASPPTATLVVTPADAMLEVVNGAAVTQGYTATLMKSDGTMQDVTATASFTLAAPVFGTFAGPTFTARGAGAGVTEVRAVVGDKVGTAMLTVRVKGTRVDTPAPANAPDLFGAATESAAQAPAIAYPADKVLVPPNLGELDVHWRDTVANDLFEIRLKNEYVDLRIYKAGTGALWTIYSPAEWSPLASSRQPLTLTVAGLKTATPATKGTAPARTVDVTNEDARGGIYYWATNGAGILRYDVETPNIPPSKLFPAAVPTGCVGCHTLSRDGNRIAITFDSGDGRGGIMDLSTNTFLFPYERGIRWNFATFNPSGSELLALKDGQMTIYDVTSGNVITTVPGVTSATHPELSPDGTQLAYVESSGRPDYFVNNGGVVVRDYTEATHTFGAPRMLVPFAAGTASYYPSWSPDGKWLAVTRNSGVSYDNASSKVWVVRADGTLPPIELTRANDGANLTNSWARWVPFAQSFGTTNEELFYLTFSSKRPFGTRRPNAGSPQIWMTPFFPARAAAGMDPSGPSFRLPFQNLADNNHIAQWTQRVVIP